MLTFWQCFVTFKRMSYQRNTISTRNEKNSHCYSVVFGLTPLSAQDVIVLRNADVIQAKALQVCLDDIVCKKLDHQDAPSYQKSRTRAMVMSRWGWGWEN